MLILDIRETLDILLRVGIAAFPDTLQYLDILEFQHSQDIAVFQRGVDIAGNRVGQGSVVIPVCQVIQE